MSDDAIQDLLDEASTYATTATSFATIQRAQEQHRATLATIAELRSALEGRAAEIAELQQVADRVSSTAVELVNELFNEIDERSARLRRRKEARRLERCPLRARTTPSWVWNWHWCLDYPYTENDAKRDVYETHERVMVHLRERPRLP